MKRVIFFFLILFSANVFSQEINIIPKPTSLTQSKIAATFSVTPATQIVLEGSNLDNAYHFLNTYLQQFYEFKLNVVKKSSSKNVIRLNYERMDYPVAGAYRMTVDDKGIYIAGDNEAGVFYGIQTFIQLLPSSPSKKLNIPYLSIEDGPRFPYRGMHLDVARHFFPVSFIKKYIDYLALHKFNYFHWHLTEDQGWRIEIKKYPKLTEVGAWRNGTIIGRYPGKGNDGIRYGGFYTQDEIKEVVKYAAERYITVVPEIELPGHSSAAIASYPELSCFPDEPTIKYFPKQCTWHGDSSGKQVQQTWGVFDDVYCAGKENTFQFIKDVLDEVLALFPSKYIHIGGDECPKENWKRCPHCQKRIKDENLKDEHELQSYFIQRVEKYLNSKNRILIGWDEILEGGLAPNAVVMSWRGEDGGIAAAKENHDVIMTPGGWCYFDHTQSENEDSVTIGGFTPIEKVYSYEPVPKELEGEKAKHVLGAQGNVWTEYMKNTSKVEYMIFPRMSALSEVLWSPKENRNWEDFEKRLMTQFKRYDLWKANYSRAYFDLKASILPSPGFDAVLWKLETKIKESLIRTNHWVHGKLGPFQTSLMKLSTYYKEPIKVDSNATLEAVLLIKSGENFKSSGDTLSQKFHFNKATGKKITLLSPPSNRYSGDGAFTLVNGVQNEKGLARSKEFLGFLGTDCEAVIDLGKNEIISNVKVHMLNQVASWIWRPLYIEVFTSNDGNTYTSTGMTDEVSTATGKGVMEINFNPVSARFVKVLVKNWGEIPAGNPGAGSKAWLFVDEIEVNAPNP
jgi:hexosaminidase